MPLTLFLAVAASCQCGRRSRCADTGLQTQAVYKSVSTNGKLPDVGLDCWVLQMPEAALKWPNSSRATVGAVFSLQFVLVKSPS